MQSITNPRERRPANELPADEARFYSHWLRVYIAVIITTFVIFVLLWIFSKTFSP